MTWAARYSATEEPELTIYRDGVDVARISHERAAWSLRFDCPCSGMTPREARSWPIAAMHSGDLRADIAARVDLRECDRPGCAIHAIGQGLCVLHGGRDEL